MTEEKIRKRGWVKNAAIIFLAVMLVLTFFSNTIMNRSLPEISGQYVQSGTISTKIRGTGTVEAVETYEVKINETRKVKTVMVKVGQEVNTGDVLFVLSDESSDELKTAQETLDNLRSSYQRSLLQATTFDYARDNRNIAQLQEQLQKATEERDSTVASEEAYTAAKEAVSAAEDVVEAASDAVDDAQIAADDALEKLNSVTQGSEDDSNIQYAYQNWQETIAALNDAKTELETAKLTHGAAYSELEAEARQWIIDDYNAAHPDSEEVQRQAGYVTPFYRLSEAQQESYISEKLPIYLPAQAEKYSGEAGGTPGVSKYKAYTVITEKERAVTSATTVETNARTKYSEALDDYYKENAGNTNYEKYKKAYDAAKTVLNEAQKKLTAAQKTLTEKQGELSKAEENRTAYKNAVENVKNLENSLEDALFELAQQKKSDSVTLQLQELDLSDMRKDIAEQEELVERLQGGSAGVEVLADVYGVIQDIGISAGNVADPTLTLATILVPDRGYSASMSVTAEQAKKVTVGDYAEVTSGWWWSGDITARLAAIRPDPKNAQTGKLLVFEVSGDDVNVGTQLTIAMGEKSRNYDITVPNSALRSDSNGDYVLIVVAKSSPLGNRYVAQRIDVQVVSKDDVNSAVTGGLTNGDYVITNSTAPIESGMMVRMAEG